MDTHLLIREAVDRVPVAEMESGQTPLDEAVEAYLKDCVRRGLAPGSVGMYRNRLLWMRRWMSSQHSIGTLEAVGREHLCQMTLDFQTHELASDSDGGWCLRPRPRPAADPTPVCPGRSYVLALVPGRGAALRRPLGGNRPAETPADAPQASG